MGAASRWRKCSQRGRRAESGLVMDEEYFAGKERKGHVRQKEQQNRGSEAPIIEPRVERDGGEEGGTTAVSRSTPGHTRARAHECLARLWGRAHVRHPQVLAEPLALMSAYLALF